MTEDAQNRSNVESIVCTTEKTTESRNSIKNTSHNVVENRNPHESKNRSTGATLPLPFTDICYFQFFSNIFIAF
jgi:hypothetical protein